MGRGQGCIQIFKHIVKPKTGNNATVFNSAALQICLHYAEYSLETGMQGIISITKQVCTPDASSAWHNIINNKTL